MRLTSLVLLSLSFGLGASELPPDACSTSTQLLSSGFEPAAPAGAFDRIIQVPGQGPRTVRVYVPSGVSEPRRAALLITLHGSGGAGTAPAAASAMRTAWAGTADAGGFIVLAPIASGAQGGWVPSQDYPLIAAALDALMADYPIDPQRLYLHGFSAGAHVTLDLALYNAGVFAAAVAQAGVLDALAGAQAPWAAIRRIPVQVRVGTSDNLLPYAQTDRSRFLAAGWSEPDDYALVTFSGGHSFDSSHAPPAWTALCQRALLP